MLKDYLILSSKNLKRRGVRSWLTLLGILIGVAAVIALISLGDGLKTAVNSQFGVSSTELLTIQAGGLSGMGPPGTFTVKPLTKDDAEAIGKLSSIEISIPRIIKTLPTEYNKKLNIAAVGSIVENQAKEIYELQELSAEYGRLLSKGDNLKVVLGNNFADADKGGFDKAIMPGDSITVSNKKFRVIGILEKKGSFILDSVILMTETDLKALINDSNDVSVIIAKAKNKDIVEQAQKDVEKLLRERRNVKIGEEDFEVSTPQAMLATVNQILSGVQIFIVLIAAISIIIGAIGIINTMMTSVVERRKEIGIMKAIGARNSDIFLQFLVEAGMLGVIGGVTGIIIGTFIGYIGTLAINSFLGSQTSPNINFILILATLVGSFIIGAISGIMPALKAAMQPPVEALKN